MRGGNTVVERGQFGNRIDITLGQQDEQDAQCHHKQCHAEQRIETANDFVNGQQGCKYIIDKYYSKHRKEFPCSAAKGNHLERRQRNIGRDEHCRLRHEHRSDKHHEQQRKRSHKEFSTTAKIFANYFGQAQAVVLQ